MQWDYTGMWIQAMRHDGTTVRGIVTDSRVKYGGKVQHTIKQDRTGDIVLVDHENVTRIASRPPNFC